MFTLKQLIDNGWDLYRKPVDYLPVVSTLHFNCRCQTLRVNPEWDKDKLFDTLVEAQINYTLALDEFNKSYEE